MSGTFSPVRIYKLIEGERYLTVRDSLNITFYMRSSHRDIRHAVRHSLNTYLQAVGSSRLVWYVDSEGEWRQLDAQGGSFIQQWLLAPGGSVITLRERPDSNTGYQFEYHGRDLDSPLCADDPGVACAVSFWLPTEYLEEHGTEKVRALALELGAALPFNSGHAGLCFHHPEGALGLTEAIRQVCFAHPGLNISHPGSTSLAIGTRVETVQWLTFLGPPVLAEVGGVTGLRSRLRSPDTTVQALQAERAVISLGPAPEAGHTEPERTLAPYRELARLLEPWLFLDRPRLRGFTAEDMRRWERRFLVPPTA
jgi:hypothetical protein